MPINQIDICQELQEIVRCARLGEYERASLQLTPCMQRVQQALKPTKQYRPETLKKLSRLLETLFMMQKQQDWVAFADILEYEFIPLWKVVFKA